MRIAYVCLDAGIPLFGCKGASVHVQGVVSAMERAGHEVTLIGARLGEGRPAWSDHVRVVHLPAPSVPDEVPGALEEGHGAPWIASLNRDLFRTLEDLGPHDAIYERYSLWSFGAMEYARHSGLPGILEVNAPLIEEQAAHRGLTNRAGAEGVAGRVFQAASQIVAVSHEVAEYVNRHPGTAVPPVVEANGFDPTRFRETPPPDGERPFTIGFLGTLKPWHGADLLADILALVRQTVPNARLLIVGDGPERARLRLRVEAACGDDAAEFAGAVAPDEVGNWLRRMDVALAPYPADAPFYFSPLKVVEYMAAAVPPIASAIGQIPTLVRHGTTGLLVPPGDAHEFAQACLLLERDPALRWRLGQEARREAMAERTWDAVVQRIFDRALGAATHAPVFT